MPLWCLKQLKEGIFGLLLIKFPYRQAKIFLIYYNIGFLLLQVDVLMRLLIFEQIVKDTNLMFISFSHIFCEL